MYSFFTKSYLGSTYNVILANNIEIITDNCIIELDAILLSEPLIIN